MRKTLKTNESHKKTSSNERVCVGEWLVAQELSRTYEMVTLWHLRERPTEEQSTDQSYGRLAKRTYFNDPHVCTCQEILITNFALLD
jgi:hypothetical protein